MNEKVREQLADLLVSLHLRLADEEQITMTDRNEIVVEFVKRCMEELANETDGLDRKKGVVQLISLFLDKFEGIRTLKPEDQGQLRITT